METLTILIFTLTESSELEQLGVTDAGKST